MSLNGSLVGVTSHITPLPTGRGWGRGHLLSGLTHHPSYPNPYILIPLPNTNMKEKKAMITSMNVARKNIKKPATFPFSVPNL